MFLLIVKVKKPFKGIGFGYFDFLFISLCSNYHHCKLNIYTFKDYLKEVLRLPY